MYILYMSSFSSYFRKKHKYETLADLNAATLTPEAIIRIDPKDISSHILDKPGGVPLDERQRKALRMLLAIKRQEKKSGVNLPAREHIISQFVGLPSQVDTLIAQTTGEIVQETNKALKEQIEQKDLENRVRALSNQPPIPYTEEESLYKRQLELRKGGKRTKKYRKGSKKRFNKKSSKKNRKRATYKRK